MFSVKMGTAKFGEGIQEELDQLEVREDLEEGRQKAYTSAGYIAEDKPYMRKPKGIK